jgi:hypothetical protein
MLEALSGTSILTAMITPAVLISASASLIFSTANRLGRIFDRVNLLKSEVEGVLDGRLGYPDERLSYLRQQLKTQRLRAELIQRSMAALYTATVLFIASSLALASTMAVRPDLAWIATAIAMLGGAFLFAASVTLLYESRYNLKFIRGQIDFIEFLEGRSLEKHRMTTGGAAEP